MTAGNVPADIPVPRWVLVVRRDKHDLYVTLREGFDPDGRVEVILDRRRPDSSSPWIPVEADLRREERRRAARRAVAPVERRQSQRRQPLTAEQHDLWLREGFFVARRAGAAEAGE